ncbi:MAG: cytidylate kinase-like family protein [Salinivirgaceae bacterium]|nr:cytidylate kinase-like family protein [Salinivirgaceae bacterium]MBO7433100.1 cytidylate kinase-like family protein [Salinivirgaceae bacterium]MBR5168640.1 cytidylate kinase-like family protein [Salinivirgaceae bacterium]
MDNEKTVVVSIGRQFGCGGRVVGQRLAEELGYDYYDKQLLVLAAKEIGFEPEVFEEIDEQPKSRNFFQSFGEFMSGLNPADNYMSDDRLFKVQSDVIRQLAVTRNCVIVGRCSDYILRDYPNCISVFLHAPIQDRIKRVCARMPIEQSKAEAFIERNDRRRASYYNYYSNKEWGVASTYDMSLDVSRLGVEETVAAIIDFVNRMKKRM